MASRVPPAGRLGASQRRMTLASRLMQARDQVARQERTVAWHADEPRNPGRILGCPIEAGQNSGKRTGITRHAVGHDRQSVRSRRWIGIAIKNDVVALRAQAIEHAIEDGDAADLNSPFVPAAHTARQSAGQHHAKRWWMS